MSTTSVETKSLLLAAAEVDVRAGEASAPPRLRIVAYSGGPMNVGGWGQIVIDVAGVEASDRVAILADHDQRLSGVVGHGSVSVEGGSLVVDGTVTGVGQAAKDVVDLARSGFALQASVGLEPLETERVAAGKKVNVNGRVVSTGRGLTLVKRGRLREVSVVAIGADRTTSVDVAARRGINGSTGMDAKKSDAGAAVIDEAAIRASERERLREIEAVCAAPGSDWGRSAKRVAELKASAIAGDIDLSELRAEMLDILRSSRPKAPVAHLGAGVRGVSASTENVLAAALLKKGGFAALAEKSFGSCVMEAADRVGVLHTLDACRWALEMEGREVPRERDALVRAALSTMSLPVALTESISRVLLDGYGEAPQTWRSIASVRSVNDFREHKAVRPSMTSDLDPVAPGGEIKHGTLSEDATAYRANTYGTMLSVDRRDIVNDDLGFLDGVARSLGRSAMRTLADDYYKMLLANPGSFFSSGNGNSITGADTALGVDSLAAAATAMMLQTDDEDRNLDLKPVTLLVPPQLAVRAKQVLESEYIAAATNGPTGNAVRNLVRLEIEPRLSNGARFGANASAKAWYLFAEPAACSTIVAFLNGRDTPTVEYFGLSTEPNRLAASWRVYFDWGVAMCDFRAAVKAKGEA
ncbi:MAG: hypothetical protein C0468_02890 [Planctomyces sp.]|nr:hypothetical protein [Planctomyces sp.]MBA4119684.1 hypothetical protein [Isosphaera sp.]